MSTYFRTEMVNSIRQGNAIFVTGTGVSLLATGGASTASWVGLIKSGIELCADLDATLSKRWKTANLRALHGKDAHGMVRAAEIVEAELKKFPGQYYAKWLNDAVGSLSVSNVGILQALSESGAPLFTTNYDGLLESVTGREFVTWRDLSDMQKEISNPGQYVVHLHGHWRRPDSVIFGYKSYGEVLGDAGAQALLRALLTVKSVIFVGFGQGLADPNFSTLCSWLISALPETGIAPVALVRDSEYRSRQEEYRPWGINVVPYGAEYDDLELYIADLVKEAKGPVLERDTISLSWETLGPQLGRLHRRISRSFNPDFIVAMSGPGNFAPAYCLRHSADDPPLFTAVTFPRRPDRSSHNQNFEEIARKGGWVHHESDKWDVFLPNLITAFPPGSRALVFDDRVISGRVQSWVADFLRSCNYEVRRAALVVHPDSAADVDFYEQEIKGDFTFPWGGKLGRGEPTP